MGQSIEDLPDTVGHSSEVTLAAAESKNEPNKDAGWMDIIVTVEHCCDCDDHSITVVDKDNPTVYHKYLAAKYCE